MAARKSHTAAPPNSPKSDEKRPNTDMAFEIFTPHKIPMPKGPLKPEAWEAALAKYPDTQFTAALVGMLTYGARIGCSKASTGIKVYPNHSSAKALPEVLEKDLAEQLKHNRLTVHPDFNKLPRTFVSSPLGLTDKKDGSKRRIHDLSFPPEEGVNSNIHPSQTSVKYSNLKDILELVKLAGEGCYFIKRDFENAYRHIPVSPLDSPLLGFSWGGKFYEERFLPFGLSSAPFLFNLVAEGFHWILEQRLKPLKGGVVHYLDDFLVVLPKGANYKRAMNVFSETAKELGLSIKTSKNKEGQITDFVGFELDSKKMQARLPAEKMVRTRTIASSWANKDRITLENLQKVASTLQHACQVIPLGRPHLRRLLDLQETFPRLALPTSGVAMTDGAKEDLDWWIKYLPTNPSIPLIRSNRKTILLFASGTGIKGMAAYYLKTDQKYNTIPARQAYIKPHMEQISREKDRAYKELLALNHSMTLWGRSEFRGFRVIVHSDNTEVVLGLQDRMLRGRRMDPLRDLLNTAEKEDVEICAKWVPEGDNSLSAALSRSDYKRVKSVAPQLAGLLG